MDAKTITIVILSVVCVVVFVAFISLAVGMQKEHRSIQDEIAARIDAEEALQVKTARLSNIENELQVSKQKNDKLTKDFISLNDSLVKLQATNESLKKDLQIEKRMVEQLKEDLKATMSSEGAIGLQ